MFTEYVIFSVSQDLTTELYRDTLQEANEAFKKLCRDAVSSGRLTDVCIVGYGPQRSEMLKKKTFKSNRKFL